MENSNLHMDAFTTFSQFLSYKPLHLNYERYCETAPSTVYYATVKMNEYTIFLDYEQRYILYQHTTVTHNTVNLLVFMALLVHISSTHHEP